MTKRNRYKKNRSGWFSWLPGLFSLPWKRLGLWLLLGLLGAGIILLGWDFYRYTLENDRYRAELTLEGNEVITETRIRETVLSEFQGDTLPSIFAISPSRLRTVLMEDYRRFQEVRVERRLPDELRIVVRERQPIALVARYSQTDERRYYLPADQTGTLFEPEEHERGSLASRLPVVEGLELHSPGSEEFAEKWDRTLAVLRAIQTAFPLDMVDTVSIREGGFAEMVLKRPREIEVRLGLDNYPSKIQRLRSFMGTEEFQDIEEWINLSDPENVRVY